MGVVESELDQVVRQRLHLLVYPKPVPKNLLVLLHLLKVQRIKTFGNLVIFTESLLARLHWKCPARTNLHHQQLVLAFLPWLNLIDLPHRKNHAVLPRQIELKTLLADPLDSV